MTFFRQLIPLSKQ